MDRQSHIKWVSRLTHEQVDWHYRQGSISQVDFEAYMHVWETSVPRLSVTPAPAPTDPEVIAAANELKAELG